MEDISGDDVGRQETQHNDSSPCKGTSPHFDGDLGQKATSFECCLEY